MIYLSSTFSELIVAYKYSKRLTQDCIYCPEKHIVAISIKMFLKYLLNLDGWNIDYHQKEGHKVNNTEASHYNIFMEDCRNRKGQYSCQIRIDFPSNKWEVNVSDKPVMNWIVPLAPVLAKTSSIPPVRVESTISKPCYLCIKVEQCMKDHVKHA